MSTSNSIDSPAFHTRKLSVLSQKLFENSSIDAIAQSVNGPQSKNKEDDSVRPETPYSAREDTKMHRRIACCHFVELVFFMLAFLMLIWLHEVT
jgi:hypothetical protein